MSSTGFQDIQIRPLIRGADQYSRVSYPLRYGCCSEIRSKRYVWQFSLNGDIRFITGRSNNWPDPSEWLKRTVTGDWIYYSTGGYSGTLEYSGEYYVPCTQYSTNSILLNNPFDNPEVKSAVESYDGLYEIIHNIDTSQFDDASIAFIDRLKKKQKSSHENKSMRLRQILGDRITVLPPDARHVDYDVIPIVVADGCLYKCGFCALKSPKEFALRSQNNIKEQVNQLIGFYGDDLINYNSIFLGQHDALNAGIDLIEWAAGYAYEKMNLKSSYMQGANLFMFGSVDSLLNADEDFFIRLNRLPFKTFINVGLESADRETLQIIKKDIIPEGVERSFVRITEINSRFENLEITVNFLYGDTLPDGHYLSIFNMADKHIKNRQSKGTVYFSPLLKRDAEEIRGTKRKFYNIKRMFRVPCYLYLIQRL